MINFKIPDEIENIDKKFLNFLNQYNEHALHHLHEARTGGTIRADDIVTIAKELDYFLSEMFSLKAWQERNITLAEKEKDIARYKQNFVHRFVLRKYDSEWFKAQIAARQSHHLDKSDEFILEYLNSITRHTNFEDISDPQFEALCKQIAFAIHARIPINSSLVKKPNIMDWDNLSLKTFVKSKKSDFEYRSAINAKDVNYNANYCLYCHSRDKDSCKKGLQDKNNQIITNPLGNNLEGCPLEQNISEMIKLYSQGYLIGALAAAMIENPLICLTGERICNDCTKSCIYQKQDAVNIPEIESFVFQSILKQEYGFEIYFLLCIWNPLKGSDYLAKKNNGMRVFISGMGPAGISAAYHSAYKGINVTLSDGGFFNKPDIDTDVPIENFRSFADEHYSPSCFGGIMEYGITNRWDKKLLLCAYLVLARMKNINFITSLKYSPMLESILLQKLKYDKIYIANGTKNPRHMETEAKVSRFIFNASDFLMNIHLGKSYEFNSLHSSGVSLPAVVLGGGLTAIDAATQVGSYYLAKIENAYRKYHNADTLPENIRQYIADWQKVKDMDSDVEKIKTLGGVKILLRSKLNESSAYKTNHIEIIEAQKLGIEFIDQIDVQNIRSTENLVIIETNRQSITARAIIVAHGSDNTQYTFIPQDKLVYLGDLTPKFAGSVVKALASGKIAAQQLENKKADHCAFNSEYFKISYISKKIADKAYKITFCSEYLTDIAQVGDLVKLTVYDKHNKSETIPAIIASQNNEGFSIIIQQVGKSTEIIGQPNMKYDIMHASKSQELQSWIQNNLTIIYDDSRKHFAREFGKYFHNAALTSINTTQETTANKVLFLCNAENMRKFILENKLQEEVDYRWIISIPMQCMLSGVCSRCLYTNEDKNKYGCKEYFVNPQLIDIDKIVSSCNRDAA